MTLKSKVEAGFQLVAADFHTGHLLADKFIDSIVSAINSLDTNKDGISDIAEFAPLVLQAFPSLVTLWNLVDSSTLVQLIASSPVFQKVDNAHVQTALQEIIAAIQQAEATAAKGAPPKA